MRGLCLSLENFAIIGLRMVNFGAFWVALACQEYFSFELPSIQLEKRKKKIETKFMSV